MSGFLCPAAANGGATHGALLPAALASRVPLAEARVLSFILAFLRDEARVAAPLLVVGGYVRDLLLGKVPDDLDLAICLADCSPDVTVAALVARMPAFAEANPSLHVAKIKITTILSDEAKNKQLDTVKCHFTVDAPGAAVGAAWRAAWSSSIGSDAVGACQCISRTDWLPVESVYACDDGCLRSQQRMTSSAPAVNAAG